MPELPDVTVYVERLRAFVRGHTLRGIQVVSPSVVRTYAPSYRECIGHEVCSVDRIGKRIVLGFDPDLFLVIHLMISGRLRWKRPSFEVPRKRGLVGFYFDHGMLLFTEASTRKRASLHCVRGRDGLAEHNPGGVELEGIDLEAFVAALTRENRTLKRALTDPRILSGIGNAYSDEILHRARLSPLKRSRQLTTRELQCLHQAMLETLEAWTERLRREVGDGFPDRVTAFHPEMAVHGRYGQPCPVCQKAVQRIRYAESECNYCPTCQTRGRLLSDRSLARLLKEDWPGTVEELEALKAR